MDPETLIELGEYLNGNLRLDTCDNSLHHTINWLNSHHPHALEANLAWFETQGVTCDCQVVIKLYLPAREKADSTIS